MIDPGTGQRVGQAISESGGWLPFDRFMALALYAPGLGYYARHSRPFGILPGSGSDFVTAPELSPLFGRALARQVGQALQMSGTDEVWEFGAGSGALAAQLLEALDAEAARGSGRTPAGVRVRRYCIVELSGALRDRQRERLQAHGSRVEWPDALPEAITGVIVGNEVLDAMPVQLLHFDGSRWFERGVVLGPGGGDSAFAWSDRPTALRPTFVTAFPPGYTTEIHPQAEAFVATLAEHLVRGAAFFIDYGFPEAEYYHPQRATGTLMCHRAHRADTDPLADIGLKDITAHVNFSGIALAGQNAGLDVLGYTTQAHFLMNCGLLEMLAGGDATTAAGMKAIANAQKLLTEHEMGELFKVIGFAKGWGAGLAQGGGASPPHEALGFVRGDRSHTL